MSAEASVLVVDDDGVSRDVAEQALMAAGFSVTLSPSGEEAANWLVSHVPDVVLLDMPVDEAKQNSGFVRQLRGEPRFADTRLLLLCRLESASDASASAALLAVADEFLFKPLRPAELVARIRAQLLGRDATFTRPRDGAGSPGWRTTPPEELHAREKQAIVAEFAGALAHELNQPLTGVIGYAELLKRQLGELSPLYHAANIILTESQRMAEIVRKVGKIKKYETKSYVGGAKILDLEKATGGESFPTVEAEVGQRERLTSLGQIVAGVVHELNNPLTSIIAYSDYLSRKAQLRAPYEDLQDDLERLRRIGEAALRILNFSRDLVAYARPAADVPGAVRMHEVLERALVFCEHELDSSNTRVRRNFDPGLPSVRGIAGQLTQVFVNLFTNAAHAMPPGGGELRVTTRLNTARHTLAVEVADTGLGIDAQHMQKIFEPFFTTKNEGRGTGLGLSIVRSIVDTHGGTVHASSALGDGAIFTVTLPLAASGASASRRERESS